MTERLFTAYQVADILGRPRHEVQAWIESGRLASQYLPEGAVRISEMQLVRFLRQEGIDIAAIVGETLQAKPHEPLGDDEHRPAAQLQKLQAPPDISYRPAPTGNDIQPRMAMAAPLPAAPADSTTDDATDEQAPPTEPENLQAPPPDEPAPDQDDLPAADDDDESPPAPATPAPTEVQDGTETPISTDETPATDDAPADEPAEPHDRAPDEPEGPDRATARAAPRRPRVHATSADPARASAQVARALVADAAARGAQAIHLQANGQDVTLSLRLNGMLQEKTSFKRRLPKGLAPGLLDEFKSLAKLDDQTPGPQRGQFEMTVSKRTIALTVSAMPTVDGQELVLKLSDPSVPCKPLAALGLAHRDAQALEEMLDRPFGLIVVAAPPRHGTAEMLRAMTARLADGRRGVLVIERTGGTDILNATQCRGGGRDGMAWDQAVWAAEDHDCDVVAVGDIGDPSTAAAAVDSALAGRMVLGGMRAGTCVEAIRLLMRMGVRPWPLASTLVGTVALRTVPALCTDCRKPTRAAKKHLAALGLTGRDMDFETFISRGCEKCGNTGYRGQAMLAAVWAADEALADVIRDGAAAEALADTEARATGADLLATALDRARKGLVALEDLVRAGLGKA